MDSWSPAWKKDIVDVWGSLDSQQQKAMCSMWFPISSIPGVSWNGGDPKWMVYKWKSPSVNGWWLGVPRFLDTSKYVSHMFPYVISIVFVSHFFPRKPIHILPRFQEQGHGDQRRLPLGALYLAGIAVTGLAESCDVPISYIYIYIVIYYHLFICNVIIYDNKYQNLDLRCDTIHVLIDDDLW